MELTQERSKVAFSSNLIIREIFINAQVQKVRESLTFCIFYLMVFTWIFCTIYYLYFRTLLIVKSEIDMADQTITKIIRRGFSLGEKILCPTEVITSKTSVGK